MSILFQAKDLKKKKKIQTKEELNVITKTIKGLNVISPNFKKPVEICVFWMRPNKLTVRMLSITAPTIFHNSHNATWTADEAIDQGKLRRSSHTQKPK